MLQFLFLGFLMTNTACHEPCKMGYGRAADKLCYPLADEPEADCGEDMARTDEGACVSVTTSDGGGSTSDGSTGGGSTDSGSTSSGSSDDGSSGDGTTDGGGSAGTGEDAGTEDGGGSAGDAGTTDGAGATDGGGDPGSSTIKGVLNTTDGIGFSEGDSVLIQVWSEGSIDEETGEPLGDGLARASEVAGAAVTAISIHFEFAITEVPAEGEEIRLTAHIVEDLLVWEGEPMGIFPIDPIEWVIIVPGETLDGVNIVINNGGDGGGTTGDGGMPPDTGLPPLDDGGGSGDEGGGPGPTG